MRDAILTLQIIYLLQVVGATQIDREPLRQSVSAVVVRMPDRARVVIQDIISVLLFGRAAA